MPKGLKRRENMTSYVVWRKGRVPRDMLAKRLNKEPIVTFLVGVLEAFSEKKRGFENILLLESLIGGGWISTVEQPIIGRKSIPP